MSVSGAAAIATTVFQLLQSYQVAFLHGNCIRHRGARTFNRGKEGFRS